MQLKMIVLLAGLTATAAVAPAKTSGGLRFRSQATSHASLGAEPVRISKHS